MQSARFRPRHKRAYRPFVESRPLTLLYILSHNNDFETYRMTVNVIATLLIHFQPGRGRFRFGNVFNRSCRVLCSVAETQNSLFVVCYLFECFQNVFTIPSPNIRFCSQGLQKRFPDFKEFKKKFKNIFFFANL